MLLRTGIVSLICLGISAGPFRSGESWAGDQPQWGQRRSRNMVSPERHLAESFDPATGRNIKWSAPLGSNAYASPVIASGKVLIGANNAEPRDGRHQGDRSVLLCLNEADGALCWQLVVPRLDDEAYLIANRIGMCSPPTVEGNRVYTVTNRFEVVCLDLNGQRDGNDGPYLDEGRHMAPPGAAPMAVSPTDGDIIWLLDLPSEVGMHPHDDAHSSILLDGDYLYVNTGNAVDKTHRRILAPDAPSLVVLDKATGRLAAQDGEHIGPRIFHSTWSSPALGDVGGRPLVFFCGGDGVCYAFEPLRPTGGSSAVKRLERVWRFDCDPAAPKEDVHRFNGNRMESPSNIKSMPVFYKNRLYVTGGGDIWWGKNEAWLQCIDATQTGDITDRGRLWSYPLERHCCATPSIDHGLVFVGDCGRQLHCVDAETGRPHWTHTLGGAIWGSTLAADGKVYVGSQYGDFWILAAQPSKQVLLSTKFDSPIVSTPAAANGVLYVATQERLYAVQATRPPRASAGTTGWPARR